jgi:hypothetical protein
VFRNHVETQIIPTTWREGGDGAEEHNPVCVGMPVSRRFNLSVDPASDEGRESPLGSIHQELALLPPAIWPVLLR